MKLEIDNLTVAYPKRRQPILENFSFSASSGEIIGITGPNGSGKTTLLKAIFGAVSVSDGSVTLDSRPCSAGDIAFMEQNAKLLPMLSVAENLYLPLKLCGIKKQEADRIIKSGLKILNLTKYALLRPLSLSKGTEQRASLLRTVLFGCEVILLDEPFSAMDRDSRELCKNLLTELKNQGKIIILTAHRRSDLTVCTKTVGLESIPFSKAI